MILVKEFLGNDSILTDKQERLFRKDYPDGKIIVVHVRHDDRCNNGYNTFSITTNVYEPHVNRGEPTLINERTKKKVWLSSCGCQHDLVKEYFPELEHLIKWHLTSTDGPMHYITNSIYWAEEGNLDYARKTAIWFDATKEQLSDKIALIARLPALMAEFRRDIEDIGFIY
jgi:hypothetical protein